MLLEFLVGFIIGCVGFVVGFATALMHSSYAKTRDEYYEEYLKRHDLS